MRKMGVGTPEKLKQKSQDVPHRQVVRSLLWLILQCSSASCDALLTI